MMLGPVEVRRQGAEIRIGGPKERALLVALALDAGKVVSRRRLVEVLWDGCAPSSAASKVECHVSALRRNLGQTTPADGPVRTAAPGYRLLGEDIDLDLGRFMNLTALAATDATAHRWAAVSERLTAALALWRGPAFGNVESTVIGRAAAAWEERRLLAVERKAEADLALGRTDAVLVDTTLELSTRPLRERLRGLVMIALYQRGCRAEALEVYQAGRRIMAAEIGLEPGRALHGLHQAMLTESQPLPLGWCPVPRSPVRAAD